MAYLKQCLQIAKGKLYVCYVHDNTVIERFCLSSDQGKRAASLYQSTWDDEYLEELFPNVYREISMKIAANLQVNHYKPILGLNEMQELYVKLFDKKYCIEGEESLEYVIYLLKFFKNQQSLIGYVYPLAANTLN